MIDFRYLLGQHYKDDAIGLLRRANFHREQTDWFVIADLAERTATTIFNPTPDIYVPGKRNLLIGLFGVIGTAGGIHPEMRSNNAFFSSYNHGGKVGSPVPGVSRWAWLYWYGLDADNGPFPEPNDATDPILVEVVKFPIPHKYSIRVIHDTADPWTYGIVGMAF